MTPVPVRALPAESSRLCERLQRGFSLFEVLATLAMLATLMAAWLPMQHAARKLQRASQRRQIALFEAAGALERLAAWPAADLMPERTVDIGLTTAGRNALPEGQMQVDLQPVDDGELRGLRVAVRITWRESSDGQRPQQVELVTWRYTADDAVKPDGEDPS
jgi:prepilin-type N-terminal cleavage/methylation domain-containing protein